MRAMCADSLDAVLNGAVSHRSTFVSVAFSLSRRAKQQRSEASVVSSRDGESRPACRASGQDWCHGIHSRDGTAGSGRWLRLTDCQPEPPRQRSCWGGGPLSVA